MNYKGIIQKSEKNNKSKAVSRYLAATTVFVLVAFFGMINSVFAQKRVITLRVGEEKQVHEGLTTQIDTDSVRIDYDLRTQEADGKPTIAKASFNEDRVAFFVEGIREGETRIKLKVNKVGVETDGKPGENPLEQGLSFGEIIKVKVISAESEYYQEAIEIRTKSPKNPKLFSLMNSAEFDDRNGNGTRWRNLGILVGGAETPAANFSDTIAAAEVNFSRMTLDITGIKSGKTTFTLTGEKREGQSWRKVFCEIMVEVIGQTPKSPTTPDGIRQKLDKEIKPLMDDLDNLSPAKKTELLNDLKAIENRINRLIAQEEESEIVGVTEAEKQTEARAREKRLEQLRNLLNEVGQIKQLVEESINKDKNGDTGRAIIFDRLKKRYERELKPAAANAENLTDAQKSALRREWEPIPTYLEQLIGEETNSAAPRAEFMQQMGLLKKAIQDDLEKLKSPKKTPLVLIHYGDTRSRDAEAAAEILKRNGYNVKLEMSRIHFPGLYRKLQYAPDGTTGEAGKIAELVKTVERVTLEAGSPPQGYQWVYVLNLFDPNKFP